MLSPIQTNNKFTITLNKSKQNLPTERSLPSDDRYLSSAEVAPWSGDQYYSKIKQLIKSNNQRKRSETSTAFRSKISFGKQQIFVAKIKNVELQVTNPSIINQWSRTVSKKSSHKLSAKYVGVVQKVPDYQKSNKKCITMNVSNEVNPIHFRKCSLRQLPQGRMKTEKNQQEQQQRIKKWHQQRYKLNKGKEKQSRMFFFQTKNSSNMSNREKMIMKIRNIEKGRVQRVYTQAY